MERAKVTALIPAGNEAHQIREAIHSVEWADEVFVVADAAGTDGTATAAGSVPGVRVEVHEYGYSAAQKNWAIPRASHPWIFLLDADERCTSELREEVLALLARGPKDDAYWIRRRNLYFGRVMRFGGWQTDSVIRLFRRECRYADRRVHAEIGGFRSAGRLAGFLLHDTFRDWEFYLAKLDRYTTWGAEQDLKDGKRAGFVNVALRPAFRFVKQYVLRLGFLDGIPGVIAVYLAVYGVFLKYAKMWDMQRRSGEGGRPPST
jgi:glycosyltransferase involved in cell wall biosynthesis